MTNAQPPLSPDGRWRWDGQAWQPHSDLSAPGLGRATAAPPGGRWSRGLRLARASWSVLRSNPALGLLPVLSLAGLVAYLLPLLGIAAGLGAFEPSQRPLAWVLAGWYYLGASFITVFFNAALVAGAIAHLRGERPGVGDCLRIASARAGRLLAYALISATVGLALRLVREEFGIVGRLVSAVVGIAWGVATAFAVPVLVLEDVSAVDSIRRSMQILRDSWGESLVGNAAITLPLLAAGVGVAAAGVVGLAIAPALGVLILVVGIGGLCVVGAALSGIFRTAVYAYATGQGAMRGFDAADLSTAFAVRRRRRGLLP
ncbi:MAG TPA: DUF6159 family protein [Candidatus Dormibacteraeota bacterium]